MLAVVQQAKLQYELEGVCARASVIRGFWCGDTRVFEGGLYSGGNVTAHVTITGGWVSAFRGGVKMVRW